MLLNALKITIVAKKCIIKNTYFFQYCFKAIKNQVTKNKSAPSSPMTLIIINVYKELLVVEPWE